MFDMDIRSYFGSSFKPSTSHKPVSVHPDSSSSSSDDEEGAVPPTKNPRISTREPSKKYRTTSSSTRKYQKSGIKTLRGYNMMLIVHSANCARHLEGPLNELVEYGQKSLSPTGR